MKKTLVTIIVLCLAIGAFAQFEKGKMLVGGALNIQSYKDKIKSGNTVTTLGTSTSYSFTPQFGYFVIDNLAVGAGLINSFSKYKSDNTNLENTTTSFQFQPFARYYLPQRIFFQGTVGVGAGNSKDYQDNKESFSLFSLAASVGYAILLTEKITIEPVLGYGSTSAKYGDTNPELKDINTGISVQVGIQVYIGK